MKQSSFNPTELTGNRVLILSDGKPGHFNQAVAFARYLNCSYDVIPVALKARLLKWLSYLLDNCGIYWSWLFSANVPKRHYSAVVSAGSGTYYANKTIARQLSCAAVAIMYPQGYRLNFDLIIAQEHDQPTPRPNILTIPVNLSWSKPEGYVVPAQGDSYIAFIIGGDSPHGTLDVGVLKSQIIQIRELFPNHKVWLTTSRRTSARVETMLRDFSYDYAVYYSQQQINPISDFLVSCDYVFITGDSSSMISEAVSHGRANVEVLPLTGEERTANKIRKMISLLSNQSCLHYFDGTVGCANCKIKLDNIVQSEKVMLALGLIR